MSPTDSRVEGHMFPARRESNPQMLNQHMSVFISTGYQPRSLVQHTLKERRTIPATAPWPYPMTTAGEKAVPRVHTNPRCHIYRLGLRVRNTKTDQENESNLLRQHAAHPL